MSELKVKQITPTSWKIFLFWGFEVKWHLALFPGLKRRKRTLQPFVHVLAVKFHGFHILSINFMISNSANLGTGKGVNRCSCYHQKEQLVPKELTN